MAVTNLLTAGGTAATSAPFALAGGQTMTLAGASRVGADGNIYWRVMVDRRMSDGAWEEVAELSWERKQVVVYGDGEYRVRRLAGPGCLVDGALA